MEAINELELRALLDSKPSPNELVLRAVKILEDASLSWEEKRPVWHFLYNTDRDRTLVETLKTSLADKQRIPYDILVELCASKSLQPPTSVLQSFIKGLKKHKAHTDLLNAKGWDHFESRIGPLRQELLDQLLAERQKEKENLKEKFEFLKNQCMGEQAERVLKQLIQTYPEEAEFKQMKRDYEEEWAREVLSSHIATLQQKGLERTVTQPSTADEEMLKCFLLEGEQHVVENREAALDLAISFWYLEDYARALEILAWAPVTASSDWMRAEVLFAGRRFAEALEHLTQMEIKYIEDPETTFSVSYLRAQCLHALGQETPALEIMQSIVRVRAHYRSAHAFILEWSAGASWE